MSPFFLTVIKSALRGRTHVSAIPTDIDVSLDQAWRHDTSHRANLSPNTDTALRKAIAGQGLRTLLQPIVSLPSGLVVGYEALSRGPEGSALETANANALFGAGERFSLTVELELAGLRQAVSLAARLPGGRWLSINVGLAALSMPGAVESLVRPGIVLTITERLPLDQPEAYAAIFAKARTPGARLALETGGSVTGRDAHVIGRLRANSIRLVRWIFRTRREAAGRARDSRRESSKCKH
jgi:EAL domain